MPRTQRIGWVAGWLVVAGSLPAMTGACGPAVPPPETTAPEPEPEVVGPPPVSPACAAALEQAAPSETIDLRSTGPSAVAGRTRESVRDKLQGSVPRLRYCRDAAVREGADPSAGIAIRFTVLPTGEVCEATVLSNPSANDTFAACTLAVVRGLAFGESARLGEGDYRPSVGVIYAFQDTGVD